MNWFEKHWIFTVIGVVLLFLLFWWAGFQAMSSNNVRAYFLKPASSMTVGDIYVLLFWLGIITLWRQS
jgi:formate/nitrite transporter FocA (FNT family)